MTPDPTPEPGQDKMGDKKRGVDNDRLLSLAALLLIALGALLVLSAGGAAAYREYERSRFEAEIARTPLAVLTDQSRPTLTPTPPSSAPAGLEAPRRVLAPAAEIDARVAEAQEQGGRWIVPKYSAGHIVGTAYPGQVGNIVLSGHFESRTSGNVFAFLDALNPGDRITIVTDTMVFEYTAFEKRIVDTDELVGILSSDPAVTTGGSEKLTLVTSTGEWLESEKDFAKRLIVFAERSTRP